MTPDERYTIHESLATGDFATVYKAHDRELGRDVAVKQIHAHFLADAGKLDRYWKEAQILASLHHPHVMTIYDLVRPKGWLVLELMQGSLPAQLKGQPIRVDDLRKALIQAARALEFLHSKGVIHGDVKPGNLLVDMRNRLKIGDFGLARRAGGDDGSLLKGTTKYMAPEVVSDQFGPVGPASDLYSLGFSAYELLCGENFESLFPGLNVFGRDKQTAWLMWHAAPDRRLPEISRVLQGVPEDLARVVEKLTAKDPARRYSSATQALAELEPAPTPTIVAPSESELAEQAEHAAERKSNRRLFAIIAFLGSLVLSLLIFFLPSGDPAPAPYFQGFVTSAPDSATRRMRVASSGANGTTEVDLAKYPIFEIEDRPGASVEAIQEGDFVEVRFETGAAGDEKAIVMASTPKEASGEVIRVDADSRPPRLDILVEGEGTSAPPLTVLAPEDAEMQLDLKDVSAAAISPGDKVVIRHYRREGQRYLKSLRAMRPKDMSKEP